MAVVRFSDRPPSEHEPPREPSEAWVLWYGRRVYCTDDDDDDDDDDGGEMRKADDRDESLCPYNHQRGIDICFPRVSQDAFLWHLKFILLPHSAFIRSIGTLCLTFCEEDFFEKYLRRFQDPPSFAELASQGQGCVDRDVDPSYCNDLERKGRFIPTLINTVMFGDIQKRALGITRFCGP